MDRDIKQQILLSVMQQATAKLNSITTRANYDMKQYGQWRCDYNAKMSVAEKDFNDAHKQLSTMVDHVT